MELKNTRRLLGMWMLVGLAGCGPAMPGEEGVEATPAGAETSATRAPDKTVAKMDLTPCGEGQTFVTNEQLDAVGFGAVADPDSAGSCMGTDDWELMQKDAARLVGVEVMSTDEQQAASGEGRVSAQAGTDYFLKNITATTTNTLIDRFQCRNYSYTYSQGCSISLSGSVSQNINLSVSAAYGVVSATLGYSVTWSTTKTYSSSTTINPRSCIEYRFYSNYKVNGFELWEDDIWYDDYIGSYKTRKYNYTWVGQYSCSL